MLNLALYLPGLFDPVPLPETETGQGLETLELLLARASRQPLAGDSSHAVLSRLFGYTPATDEDIPMAAIGRLIDDDKRPQGYWMRADPVHLHADQKSLVLLDVNNLSLTQHDALALAACVAPCFAAMHWELEVPVPGRWYARLDKKPAIRTFAIDAVTGRDIRDYMPAGEDAATWHRLMNELQMTLHNADINKLREERGELPINSLWLWGSGELPGLLERRWSRVYSDDTHSMGLAMLSSTPCQPLPQSAEELFAAAEADGNILVVMSDFQVCMLQQEQQQRRLQKLEREWCQPLLQGLRNKKLGSLRIITRAEEFRLGPRSPMKIWKRPQAFTHYLQQAGHS